MITGANTRAQLCVHYSACSGKAMAPIALRIHRTVELLRYGSRAPGVYCLPGTPSFHARRECRAYSFIAIMVVSSLSPPLDSGIDINESVRFLLSVGSNSVKGSALFACTVYIRAGISLLPRLKVRCKYANS